ncbi:type II toxin-antitoxin system HicB family antitoxin [Crocosphaera sp. XPORK-15E]|uniref:type II toxin-antitoxin system HicB family antitoxin n=1 Tax=Crocosphaera sp. XPORK-15E TaxID=3110247 RepID=UPI002B21B5AC|nr:type II toxin-antitoxin system HicB family antitoxin [Crocosphaera sp. XPORK-15E]MEA5534498.1 type II toxin-antitoxin system HicB family antitoxin [Crocosphaera sp. XPORK-15E]
MNYQYSIVIQWSDEDQKYIVSLPEFGPYAHTHGNSYEEALKNAQEMLELLIEDYKARNKTLPKPSNLKITVEV